MSTPEQIAKRFENDTANHEMTVLHDDGLYRHLRFAKPDSSRDWFSIVTWPQKLVINGSVGTYVFSRMEDMFDFIRTSCPAGSPNYTYWEEKVVACGDPVVDYSTDLLDKQVTEHLKEVEAEKYWPGVAEAWNEKVYGFFAEYDTTNEHGARCALHDFTYKPDGAPESEEPFQFYDTVDWDLRDYDWKYLWSCHAIQWGIGQYDSKRVAATQAVEVTS
ncbi:MAG: hypothetical protein JWN00_1455 [Actinomycetia bacterium]|nr:hypothetical protein [Actinomycetes bacterium]